MARKNRKSKKESFAYELHAAPAYHIKPLTPTQGDLLDSLNHSSMVVAIGSAGTGKTYCVTYKAAQMLLEGEIQRIVLTRANQPAGKSIGFFPGTLEDKMRPWILPMLNNLKDALGSGKFECAMKSSIEIQPVETIRGQSFDNAFIIIDEAQNLTFDEVKAISTRLGQNSVMAFCGDPAQSDVSNGRGIERFISICEKHKIDLPVTRFTVEDIVRSDMVGQLCKAFELEEAEKDRQKK